MDNWISVEERLPEPLHDVLVYNPSSPKQDIYVSFWMGTRWYWDATPTHWQPLPEPPEVQP